MANGKLANGNVTNATRANEDAERLVFAGKVGTGFTTKSACRPSAGLERIEITIRHSRRRPPAGSDGTRTGSNRSWSAKWRSPSGPAKGKIRHPSFQGLRADKLADAHIGRESAAPPPKLASTPRTKTPVLHATPPLDERRAIDDCQRSRCGDHTPGTA